jgi:hypothetical protein
MLKIFDGKLKFILSEITKYPEVLGSFPTTVL